MINQRSSTGRSTLALAAALLVYAIAGCKMYTPEQQRAASSVVSSAVKIYPPWGRSPTGGHAFVAPNIDNVADLYGDIVDPDLVVFFAGNQFMVVPDLIDAFRAAHPQYKRIFVETLPPGVLASQMDVGALVLSNLRIDLKPDVYAAGAGRIAQMQQSKKMFDTTVAYADNRLAIMVREGDTAQVHSWADLGNPSVRVSMPNPEWEGIGKQIEQLYRRAGGQALDTRIMKTKVAEGTTLLTQIHHRQTPINLMQDVADAGPTWYTEAYFQRMIGSPIDVVELPDSMNLRVTYVAGSLKTAPHRQAARDFVIFMRSPAAQAVYHKYGFLSVKMPGASHGSH